MTNLDELLEQLRRTDAPTEECIVFGFPMIFNQFALYDDSYLTIFNLTPAEGNGLVQVPGKILTQVRPKECIDEKTHRGYNKYIKVLMDASSLSKIPIRFQGNLEWYRDIKGLLTDPKKPCFNVTGFSFGNFDLSKEKAYTIKGNAHKLTLYML